MEFVSAGHITQRASCKNYGQPYPSEPGLVHFNAVWRQTCTSIPAIQSQADMVITPPIGTRTLECQVVNSQSHWSVQRLYTSNQNVHYFILISAYESPVDWHFNPSAYPFVHHPRLGFAQKITDLCCICQIGWDDRMTWGLPIKK